MADVKWIKIVTDIFDNRKIRQIERLPDADAIIVIWFKLLCLAGNINESGMILFTSDIPYTDEMLAHEFNRPINTVRMALQTYERFGMIEIVDNIYMVSNWEKYQNIEAMDKIREQTRIRVANYRKKQKLLSEKSENDCDNDVSDTCNVTVTQSNAIDKNKNKNKRENKSKNIEKEIDKEKADPVQKRQTKNILDLDFIPDESVRNSFAEFIEHRKQIKKPMTQLAVEKAYKGLVKMYQDSATQIAAIDNAIAKGWQGIYPLDNHKPAKGGGDNDLGKFRSDTALPY